MLSGKTDFRQSEIRESITNSNHGIRGTHGMYGIRYILTTEPTKITECEENGEV